MGHSGLESSLKRTSLEQSIVCQVKPIEQIENAMKESKLEVERRMDGRISGIYICKGQ